METTPMTTPDEYGPCGCVACRCRVLRDDLARYDAATDATRTGWALSDPIDAGSDVASSARALLASLEDRP